VCEAVYALVALASRIPRAVFHITWFAVIGYDLPAVAPKIAAESHVKSSICGIEPSREKIPLALRK
jgi:hypothetical protein